MKSEKSNKRRNLSPWRQSRRRRLEYAVAHIEKMIGEPAPSDWSEQRRCNVEKVRASYILRLPRMKARLDALS